MRCGWIGTVGVVLAIVIAAVVGGCERSGGGAGATGAAPAGALRVLATTQQLADAIRNIAGERLGREVVVDALLGEGVDPHTYKLTRSDAARLNDAQLVIFNGLYLEGKMADVLGELERSGKRVVKVGERLPKDGLLLPEGSGGQPDPHFWMDTDLYMAGVEVLREELAKADPAGAEAYAKGAEALKREIERIDAYAKAKLGAVPEAKRLLVTSHDAFGYFGRRYGLRVQGVQGISTESEAGLRDIENLVDLLVREKAGAVFVESSVSRRTLDAVVAGAAAKGHTIIIGGELFSDAMGAPGTYEGTYIGMMDHNITTIGRAWGATVPERGLNGKLSGGK